MESRRHTWIMSLAALTALVLAGCDATEPGTSSVLVVEAFIDEGRAVGGIVLRQSLPMNVPYSDANGIGVSDAEPRIRVGGEWVMFAPAQGQAGRYMPLNDVIARAGDDFVFEVLWKGERAFALGVIPPPLKIRETSVLVPERPIEAILLDSLQLDSLQTGARSAYVYPVEVSVWWTRDDGGSDPDSLYWIRTQLRPYITFESGVTELFFRSEGIFREDRGTDGGNGLRRWSGVYLVPVDAEDVPIPAHRVRVSLLRSSEDYARFASSRQSPERREPISNVLGGVGIVAGISVDSLTLQIP